MVFICQRCRWAKNGLRKSLRVSNVTWPRLLNISRMHREIQVPHTAHWMSAAVFVFAHEIQNSKGTIIELVPADFSKSPYRSLFLFWMLNFEALQTLFNTSWASGKARHVIPRDLVFGEELRHSRESTSSQLFKCFWWTVPYILVDGDSTDVQNSMYWTW
jgi:hypothetical protein